MAKARAGKKTRSRSRTPTRSRAATHKESAIVENIVAAHETLEDAGQKIGKAANVLMRRIEELSAELEDLRDQYDTDLATSQNELKAAEKSNAQQIASLERLAQRDLDALKTKMNKLEMDYNSKLAVAEDQKQKLDEKLRKVQLELA